jgi:hypothetical protein
MAATKQEEGLARINHGLDETLKKVKDLNRNPVRRGETRIEANLEEELRRRRLTTNDPT